MCRRCGGSLALAIFFIPAVSRLPITTQREIGANLGERATPIIDILAPAILVLGIVRGTLLGPSTRSRKSLPLLTG